MLFILYTRDLEKIASKYGFSIHLYADDTQIYFAFDPSHSFADHMERLTAGFDEIQLWMCNNILKLNGEKTEIMVLKNNRSMFNKIKSFELHPGVTISKSDHAKNLGFYFDSHLSLEKHINNTVSACYNNLRIIGSIRKYISNEHCEQLVHALITSKLDYVNSIYIGLPKKTIDKLQRVQNAALRLILKLRA